MHLHNTGAAFGLFPDRQLFLIVVGILVLALVTVYKQKKKDITLPLDIGLGFLIGGNLGNLFDRIFHGFVIDFIKIPHWPTFNVADLAINFGVIFIIGYLLYADRKEKAKEKAAFSH